MKKLIIFLLLSTGVLLKGAVVFFDQGVLLTPSFGLFEIDFDGNDTTDISFEKITSPIFNNHISVSPLRWWWTQIQQRSLWKEVK